MLEVTSYFKEKESMSYH